VASLSNSPFMTLTLARLREFYRQPEAVFWVYFFPLLMVVALGVAFRNRPVENITIDAVDSAEVTALSVVFRQDERIIWQVATLEDCRRRLRTGKSDLFLVVTPGTTEEKYSVDYHFDPTKPGSVVARDTIDNLVQKANGRQDPVISRSLPMSEPGGRYIDFLVPGLIGMGLMGGGMWGVGFAIVDMRIRKVLKRMIATPMRKADFLAAIMTSRLVFMIPEMILLIVFARYVFDVRVHGSWPLIIVIILLGAFQFSGIGLLVASRTRTIESVSGLMNLVMLPMWTLSGIFFSYERFPEKVQPLIQALPLTPLIDSLRGVMLEGATIETLWPKLAIIFAWGIVTFALALRLFRWQD
jgi:ABC-2 type transport system permease protein